MLALLRFCDFLRRRSLSGDFDLSYSDSRSVISQLVDIEPAPIELEPFANNPIVD